MNLPLTSLDPPYRLTGSDPFLRLIGWAEVDDIDAPDIRIEVNGLPAPAPVVTTVTEGLSPAMFGKVVTARNFWALIDCRPLLGAHRPQEPFLVEVTVVTDGRRRTFEYEASDDWLQAVFGRAVAARKVPPEALQIRVTGAAVGGYHATGRKVADQIEELLAAVGAPLSSFHDILDFGCGPGRVITQMRERLPKARLSGSDIDPEAIAWAQANLADVGDFKVNGLAPPLPFADASFDLIYGISVFTHLPEDQQHAWLADLRRVLKPGGVLLTTKLDPAPYDIPAVVKHRALTSGFAYWDDADLTDGLPDFYRLAYHTDAYVQAQWGRYFEVMRIARHGVNNTQDAVILRRPRQGLSWLPTAIRKSLRRPVASAGDHR